MSPNTSRNNLGNMRPHLINILIEFTSPDTEKKDHLRRSRLHATTTRDQHVRFHYDANGAFIQHSLPRSDEHWRTNTVNIPRLLWKPLLQLQSEKQLNEPWKLFNRLKVESPIMHAGVHIIHCICFCVKGMCWFMKVPQFASTACRCKLGHEASEPPFTSCYGNQFGHPLKWVG